MELRASLIRHFIMSVTLRRSWLKVIPLNCLGHIHRCPCTRRNRRRAWPLKSFLTKHLVHRHSHDAHAIALPVSKQSHFLVQCAKKIFYYHVLMVFHIHSPSVFFVLRHFPLASSPLLVHVAVPFRPMSLLCVVVLFIAVSYYRKRVRVRSVLRCNLTDTKSCCVFHHDQLWLVPVGFHFHRHLQVFYESFCHRLVP